MSSRQPPSKKVTLHTAAATFSIPMLRLILNLTYSGRIQACQKIFRFRGVEFSVLRFDRQKKLVLRGAVEARHVERRVIRLRKAIQREHAEHGAERRAQNGELERDRNPVRPTVVRLAAYVDRIAQHVGVPLHAKTGDAAEQAAG